MRVRSCGEDAVLLEVDAAELAATYDAVLRALRGGAWSAREVVPAATTVLLEGLVGPLDELVAQVARLREHGGAGPGGDTVEVPTVYDGEDLDEVARLWEMTRAEVVSTHVGIDFQVAFCGFAPGFAYCTGLPEPLHVPRRRTPRSRVPAGSVGLAGGFTGIYPTASPGGWQLLGRTDLRLWDSEADPPARLPPGTRVRFVETERS